VSRNDDIVRRVKAGETYQSIGTDLGLTRERVRQIAALGGVRSSHWPNQKRLHKKIVRLAPTHTSREIADELGVSTSIVLDALRRAGVEAKPKPLVHNRTGYLRGCRCAYCSEATRAYAQALRDRPGEPPSHGYSGYVNYRCRCDICRAAMAEANKRYQAKRKARKAGLSY